MEEGLRLEEAAEKDNPYFVHGCKFYELESLFTSSSVPYHHATATVHTCIKMVQMLSSTYMVQWDWLWSHYILTVQT